MRSLFPAALFLCASPALADVLDPAVVDARARVLVHVDVSAITEMKLFQLAYEEYGPEIEEGLVEFQEETGLHPLEDLLSLTVYSNDVDEDHWVACLRTTDKLDGALDLLKAEPGYSVTETDAGKTVHSFSEDGEQWFGHLYKSRPGGERMFVITESVAVLEEALEVVEGKRKNVAAVKEPAISLAPSPGAALFVSADRGLGDIGDFSPSSEVAGLVTGVLFECGEADEMLFASLRLDTASEKDARDIYEVVQGGLALASLLSGRDESMEPLSEFIDALDVQRDKARVEFAFRYSSDQLWSGLGGMIELAEGVEHR